MEILVPLEPQAQEVLLVYKVHQELQVVKVPLALALAELLVQPDQKVILEILVVQQVPLVWQAYQETPAEPQEPPDQMEHQVNQER
jgi:hypothetical protein